MEKLIDINLPANYSGSNVTYLQPWGSEMTSANPIDTYSWWDRNISSSRFEAENNAYQSMLNRQFQSEEAYKQRLFEAGMSNTAYQRAVADMRKAGLNPYLAYSNGSTVSASTPAGASASGSQASISANGSTLTNLVGSALQLLGKFLTRQKT